MTTQEAINQLNKMAVTDRDYEAVNMVTDFIMHGGWIPVTERLPEIPPDKIADGYVQIQVLVLCDGWRQCAWFQVDTKKFYDQPGWLGIEVYGVTHWMPLPQPPKEE